LYDDIADIYLEIFPINQAFLAFIPEFLGKPGATVLDLGCGPGQTAKYLTDLGVEISGLDLSEKILEQASAATPAVPWPTKKTRRILFACRDDFRDSGKALGSRTIS